jgi:hypothetical protein
MWDAAALTTKSKERLSICSRRSHFPLGKSRSAADVAIYHNLCLMPIKRNHCPKIPVDSTLHPVAYLCKGQNYKMEAEVEQMRIIPRRARSYGALYLTE